MVNFVKLLGYYIAPISLDFYSLISANFGEYLQTRKVVLGIARYILPMHLYPLVSLRFYIVNKDFSSDQQHDGQVFKKGMTIQYQGATSNIHDMMEIISFKDYSADTILVWETRIENLYDNWAEYFTPVKNPLI